MPPGCLGGKRALAKHLKHIDLESMAPMSFLSPFALRRALEPKVPGAVGFEDFLVSPKKVD